MKNIFTILFAITKMAAFCQVGGISISPNNALPAPSAALDINYTDKGLLIPRLTQAQRDSISAPALGLAIFNTTDNCYEGYGFGNWQTISCLCTGAPSSPSVITGNNNPCANASNITYSVGLVLGTTSYTWAVPADATIIAGQGTNSITVNFGVDTGSISVTANNSCGSSSPSVLPVSINTIPSTPGSISGSDSVCSNTSGNVYSISPVAGATTYTWTVPGDAIITSGQGTTSATVTFGTTSGIVAITSGNVCGNSAASILIVTNTLVTHGTETFYYDGNPQIFVAPGCISAVTIAAYGAQGSGEYSNGALGGSAIGTLPVASGDTLYVFVGGQNGYNGGGTGGGNGGGMSDVRLGGTSFTNWVIVAGGGGNNGSGYVNTATGTGGGGTPCANGAGGGGGGYATSGDGGQGGQGTCGDGGGSGYSNGGWAGGGGGGGLTGGGTGGVSGGYGPAGGDGSQGQGGNIATGCGCANTYAGGGGGGYYGGGGASAGCCAGGSGGGGSSWVSPSITNASFSGGIQSGNGQVIITW